MSNAQIFSQIFDRNALFLLERGAVGWIIFVVILLVESLGLEGTRKRFDICDFGQKTFFLGEITCFWSENL